MLIIFYINNYVGLIAPKTLDKRHRGGVKKICLYAAENNISFLLKQCIWGLSTQRMYCFLFPHAGNFCNGIPIFVFFFHDDLKGN